MNKYEDAQRADIEEAMKNKKDKIYCRGANTNRFKKYNIFIFFFDKENLI